MRPATRFINNSPLPGRIDPGRRRRAGREAGFALVLALLSLMLLTFLGLTLAATTSTELQIAGNYRAGQQAYYNAEAGLEIGKVIIRNLQTAESILPPARVNPWVANTGAGPFPVTISARYTSSVTNIQGQTEPRRNFENAACDGRSNGAGYGIVFDDGSKTYQNVSTLLAGDSNVVTQTVTLRGAFTLWARRPVVTNADTSLLLCTATPTFPCRGQISDSLDDGEVVLTAEGVAPSAFAPARAIRLLEATVRISEPCSDPEPQESATGRRGCRQ